MWCVCTGNRLRHSDNNRHTRDCMNPNMSSTAIEVRVISPEPKCYSIRREVFIVRKEEKCCCWRRIVESNLYSFRRTTSDCGGAMVVVVTCVSVSRLYENGSDNRNERSNNMVKLPVSCVLITISQIETTNEREKCTSTTDVVVHIGLADCDWKNERWRWRHFRAQAHCQCRTRFFPFFVFFFSDSIAFILYDALPFLLRRRRSLSSSSSSYIWQSTKSLFDKNRLCLIALRQWRRCRVLVAHEAPDN